MTVSQKFRAAREARGWTREQVADVQGDDSSYNRVASYEKPSNPAMPPAGLIFKLSKIWEIPMEWFYDGLDNPVPARETYRASDIEIIPEVLLRSTVDLPYAGEVPCSSHWGDALDGDGSTVEVSAEFFHPDRFVARVKGFSCYPALLPRDLVIWHRDKNPSLGLIVLAERASDRACTVKELGYSKGRSVLTPINPEAESPPDDEGWEVVARLVVVIRNSPVRKSWYEAEGLRAHHLAEDPIIHQD